MKPNEQYWHDLYKEGLIEIDFENGIVYSWLSQRCNIHSENPKKKQLASKNDNPKKYSQSSAGPSRNERYHILLHRLIWICANGEIPPDIEVNHINGKKNDNRLSNLELVTKSEQALHSRRVLGNVGGVSRGEKSGMAKLTWNQVREIRNMYGKDGNTYKKLGKIYGVAFCNIRDIVKNKIWKEE